MKWLELKEETKELIANSIGIYYSLRERNSLYKLESVAALSLYTGVLRMGINPLIKRNKSVKSRYISGETYCNGYYLSNNVCKLLNNHNIYINDVIELLDLDKKLLNYTCSLDNHKIEQQYNIAYLNYLKMIRDYYVGSLRIKKNSNKQYCPEISMTIPNIISALYYPNIDSNKNVPNLIATITNINNVDDSLKSIESISTYNNGSERKLLLINKSIGKIL